MTHRSATRAGAAPRGDGPPVGLVARTRLIDRDVDLLAVPAGDGALWASPERGFAGSGVAAWIDVPAGDPAAAAAAVQTALGAIASDDEVGAPGCGPVALGALPFDPGRAGRLAVPASVVGRGPDGRCWLTTVGPAGEAPPGHLPDPPPLVSAEEPSRFTVRSVRPPAEWRDAVAAVRDLLRSERDGGRPDRLRKAVLAREVVVEADRPIPVTTVLSRLRSGYPSCMLYRTPGPVPLVGASPELLVSRVGDVVRAHPLAGTAPRSGDPDEDARIAAGLVRSTKDQEEHRITIDMVHDTLLPWCSYLDEEAEPSVVAMANVAHLGTRVEGRLSAPPAHVVELVRALHPTPAVGGSPRSPALDVIAAHEAMDRGCYGGPVGWVDAAGNGEFAVAIRCAELDGGRARLFAGVGVLPDSDPDAELAETRAKLQALLSAVVRP